jgi:glucosylceramidase
MFPNKFIFATEACAGFVNIPFIPRVKLGDFNRAENYARYIIQNLNHWVTGWTDWNMALNLKGGPNWANNNVEGPVIINPANDEFYKQPLFYIMGHFRY